MFLIDMFLISKNNVQLPIVIPIVREQFDLETLNFVHKYLMPMLTPGQVFAFFSIAILLLEVCLVF